MSSDSELEPPLPKRMRHTQLTSGNDDSANPVVVTLRSGRTNKHGGENEDIFVLSDIENDAASPTGSTSCGSNTDSGIPSTATLPLDKLAKNSKHSPESIKNGAKEEVASSSTGIEFDTNDLEAEKCPICWLPFTNQEVANPSTCDHRFCFHCIMEWSKTTNTCPVDRQAFNDINVRPKFGSNVTRLVPVETKVSTDTDVDAEEADLDSDSDDPNYYATGELSPPSEDEMDRISSVNESSVELATTFSTEEAEDYESIEMYASSNDDYTNPEVVVVVSSSDEEVHLSSPSEYNGLSPYSSPSHQSYLSPNLSTSTCSSPSRSPSPVVSLSSSSSPSPSPSISSSPSPSHSPSPSTSPSPTPSPSISSLLSSSPSLTVSFSRSPSCSSLSNASSASISSSS